MNPMKASATDLSTNAEQSLDGGYTREELMALLQEGLDSGLSDNDWDTLIRELNLEYFGKDKI